MIDELNKSNILSFGFFLIVYSLRCGARAHRALHDPLIVGIDHFFQHGVGQDKIRYARARADQFTVDDFHAPKKSKSLSQKAWKSDNS